MAHDARENRWRLVLGKDAQEALGSQLEGDQLAIDRALGALYDPAPGARAARNAGLGASSPDVARWLGDIRKYFPASVVTVLQKDAIARLDLKALLFEKEVLETIEPDVHLVATLISLSQLMPAKARETARAVVRKVTDDLERRLRGRLVSALRGSLSRAARTSRPRTAEIDWDRTIRKNLRSYDPRTRRLIPERLVGFRRKTAGLREVFLLVDQSGSMATSVVYAGVLGAVMASVRAITTRFIAFDTAVVDLSEHLHDPVELLFGTQLGGGTDIERALRYVRPLIRDPQKSIVVLISDLYEGGNPEPFLAQAAELVQTGARVIVLLALSDDGRPSFDAHAAAELASLGIPSFACTPDLFPDLMANAIDGRDIGLWAARNDLVTAKAGSDGHER